MLEPLNLKYYIILIKESDSNSRTVGGLGKAL
jgi:hypothetical protein